jgi:hypothetical protein
MPKRSAGMFLDTRINMAALRLAMAPNPLVPVNSTATEH